MKKFIFAILILFCKISYAEINKEITIKTQNYLNSLNNLEGKFKQISSTGQQDEGKFYISRPGKMRLEYKNPMLLIADGKDLIFKDTELNQVSYVELKNSPAGIILKQDVDFFGSDISVLKTIENLDSYEITLNLKKEPDSGKITLIFKKNPMELKSWQIQDIQGIITDVNLLEVSKDTKINDSLFKLPHQKTANINKE